MTEKCILGQQFDRSLWDKCVSQKDLINHANLEAQSVQLKIVFDMKEIEVGIPADLLCCIVE